METRIPKGGTPLSPHLPRVRKHERIHHHINNGSVSCYFYDAAGERTVKLTSESEMVHVNGKKVGGNANICKFTAYVSPYFVVSNGGAYTKHIYAANQRIASKLGNVDGFGADPRRVEQAGGLKKTDNLATTIKARYESLGIDYEEAKKEEVLPDSTMDSEEPENLVFFYHPDHLGSTSYVTDADGNIAQHVEYIPYGEVFVEERNSQFSTNFLFNAKELDNETGLYYYGARYLDPTGAMWLSVDPVFHAGTSPYAYCLGNPVKLVDPDGRVECDEDGNINIVYDVDAVKKLLNERYSSGVAPNDAYNIEYYDTQFIKIGDNGRVQYKGNDVGIARTDKVEDDKPGIPFLVMTKNNRTLDESSNCSGLAMLGGQAFFYSSYEATVVTENEYFSINPNDNFSNLNVGDVFAFTGSGSSYPDHYVGLIYKNRVDQGSFWESSFNMGFTRKDTEGPATLCYGEPKEALSQASIGHYSSDFNSNMVVYRPKNLEKRFGLRHRYKELKKYDGSH